MAAPLRITGQVIAYLLFFVAVVYFSASPAYEHLARDRSEIKLSFTHPGKLASACRKRTEDELAKMAPNMRTPEDCPRGRVPVSVELKIDGMELFKETLEPSGFSRDGPSTVYRKFVVPAGRYRITARMRDSARTEGYDYVATSDRVLVPAQILVVDFNHEAGKFTFK